MIKSSLEQRDVLLQSKNLRNGLEYCSDLIIVNVIMQQDFLDIYMNRKKENSYYNIYIWNVLIFKCIIYFKCFLQNGIAKFVPSEMRVFTNKR